jgi:hypothetical protein
MLAADPRSPTGAGWRAPAGWRHGQRFEVQRTIPVDAAAIFAGEQPRGHVAIDASGCCVLVREPAHALGDTFGSTWTARHSGIGRWASTT